MGISESGGNEAVDFSELDAGFDVTQVPLDPDQVGILKDVEIGLMGDDSTLFEQTISDSFGNPNRLLRDPYDVPFPVFGAMLHRAMVHLLEAGGAERFERALRLREKYRLPVSPQAVALVRKNVNEMRNHLMSDCPNLFRRAVLAFGLNSNEGSTELSPMFLQVFQEMVRGKRSSDQAMIEWYHLCGITEEDVKSVLMEKLRRIVDVDFNMDVINVKTAAVELDKVKRLALDGFDLPAGLVEGVLSKAVSDLVEHGKIEEAREWRKVLKIPKAEFDKWVQAVVDTGLDNSCARALDMVCLVQARSSVEVTRKRTVAARAGLLRQLVAGEDGLNLHTAVELKKLFWIKLGREVKNAAKERMEQEMDNVRGGGVPVWAHYDSYFLDLFTFAEEFGLEEEVSRLEALYIKLAMEQICRGSHDLANRIFDAIDYPDEERKQLAWGVMMSLIKADVHNVRLIKRIAEVFSLQIDDSDREVALMAVRDAFDQQPGPYHDQPRVDFPEIELMEIMGVKFGGEHEIRDRSLALKFVLNALRAGHMDKALLVRAAAVFDIDVEGEDVVQAVIAGTIADLRRHGAKRVKELFELVKTDDDVQRIVDAAVRRVARQLRDGGQYPDARKWEKEFPGAKGPVQKS